MNSQASHRFQDLTFEDFRHLAQDASLSQYEKIGFPDTYREGKAPLILNDILVKLPGLEQPQKVVLEVGPGCSDLAHLIIEHCRAKNQKLLLVDSAEMLSHLPDAEGICKIEGYYPNCMDALAPYRNRVDVLLAYSMLHYVFTEGNLWQFLDVSLSMLAPGGMILLGDIPNQSKRKRFFSSEAGIQFHKDFMQTESLPEVTFNALEPGSIDDSVIFSILQRARLQGFDAYVLPQHPALPMANRREDILIVKP